MNAVIALCHFCEAHGPSAIFCTQTLRDTKIDELNFDSQVLNKACVACNSIGISTGIISKDDESEANFLSTQQPVIQEVVTLIKQASVRSLSCEVGCNKDGGLVFFGDSSRGHVLSHTFQISDLHARGFYRLFSIVILMKDKLFLLNLQPFLSENLKKISLEIQNYAKKVYAAEEASGVSERDQRIASGGQTLSQVPRSLQELTNEKHIFAIIHSHFTWMLWAGARCLTENITFGNLPWLASAEPEYSLVNISRDCFLPVSTNEIESESHETLSLRNIKDVLGTDFRAACYCVITGLQIVIRGSGSLVLDTVMCLKKLLPEQLHRCIRIGCPQYISSSEYRIISVSQEVAVPQPSAQVFRIDFFGDHHSTKWLGEVPNKCPDLLNKIMKAIDEKLLNDIVLEKHLNVLVQEWRNKVACISRIKSTGDLNKLKKILGIQQQDQPLLNYWSIYL